MATTEQSTNQTQTVTIPKFAYPFKENQELKYLINSSREGNYLFNISGFWHGGVHFTKDEISTLNGGDSKAIKCIADGEIVAYRVNDKYLKNDGETSETKGVYSTGFFLVKHQLEYPIDNKLTFFSLYMHTAKKSEYLTTPKIVKHDLIKENSSINSIVILTTPKKVNAGDIIAITGLYNTDESEDLECLHLEVFTDEKIETFIEKSKKYPTDTNPNKPKSKDVEIAVNSKKYKLQSSTKVKLKKNLNIREGFSNTSATYQNSPTPIGTIVIVDKNIKKEVGQHTRYKVLKIGETDVSSQNLTIAKITFKTIEDINNFVEDRKISEKLYVKALEEVSNNGKDYVKIGDNEYVEKINCKQSHPITFEWARIFKDVTQDKVSIFKDLKKVLKGEESEFTDGFRNLFLKMDEDHNGKLDAIEIEEATRDIIIKRLTSKYIVSHPNEWKYEESKWGQIKDMLEDEEDKKHIEKEQKRIENLSIFEECKTAIEGFPEDVNKVYHINPIGLIGAFGVTRKRRDKNLGTLSSRYETGGRGSITVSGGIDDPGGISYGSYQFTSKPDGGNVKKFINDGNFIWKDEFTDLTPGSQEFSKKWKELVRLHGNNFSKIEHEYTKKTHFDIQIRKIIAETGVDIRYHSHTLNDVVWSTSVQHGAETNVVTKIIQNLNILEEETKVYDEKLINEIYKERGRKDSTGRLVRFPRVREISTMNNLKDRFDSELLEALKRLENETNY